MASEGRVVVEADATRQPAPTQKERRCCIMLPPKLICFMERSSFRFRMSSIDLRRRGLSTGVEALEPGFFGWSQVQMQGFPNLALLTRRSRRGKLHRIA